MSKRREFPKAVKISVIKRATRNGQTFCEQCGLPARKWQIDHCRPDGLLGEPTIENAQLLGECCYMPKNADDTSKIAKAKRREAAFLGVRKSPSFQSRGFAPKTPRERTMTKVISRKPLYEDS